MTKLRIKVGAVEIECEGSDEFLRKELPELLKTVFELRGNVLDTSAGEDVVVDGNAAGGQPAVAANNLTTSTVAAKMGVKSGSDLALAAAASLIINGGKESVSRTDILKAMQGAKSYYKASYRNNLSNYLSTLVKAQDLLDQGNDHFGLHDNKKSELVKKIR